MLCFVSYTNHHVRPRRLHTMLSSASPPAQHKLNVPLLLGATTASVAWITLLIGLALLTIPATSEHACVLGSLLATRGVLYFVLGIELLFVAASVWCYRYRHEQWLSVHVMLFVLWATAVNVALATCNMTQVVELHACIGTAE